MSSQCGALHALLGHVEAIFWEIRIVFTFNKSSNVSNVNDQCISMPPTSGSKCGKTSKTSQTFSWPAKGRSPIPTTSQVQKSQVPFLKPWPICTCETSINPNPHLFTTMKQSAVLFGHVWSLLVMRIACFQSKLLIIQLVLESSSQSSMGVSASNLWGYLQIIQVITVIRPWLSIETTWNNHGDSGDPSFYDTPKWFHPFHIIQILQENSRIASLIIDTAIRRVSTSKSQRGGKRTRDLQGIWQTGWGMMT